MSPIITSGPENQTAHPRPQHTPAALESPEDQANANPTHATELGLFSEDALSRSGTKKKYSPSPVPDARRQKECKTSPKRTRAQGTRETSRTKSISSGLEHPNITAAQIAQRVAATVEQLANRPESHSQPDEQVGEIKKRGRYQGTPISVRE
ncbi:hypothetical protein F511_33245 [Dorcoceras hygrometricum]|uniref:Uncharacterized protein n=1 Tax=Dorcoceras hygrometricum TaxID=472368 RepID=A0A2Z7D0C4_9LAMI|nr:hypothetical protein F511_33245 [Dorcoceras hygrometricum]